MECSQLLSHLSNHKEGLFITKVQKAMGHETQTNKQTGYQAKHSDLYLEDNLEPLWSWKLDIIKTKFCKGHCGSCADISLLKDG